jgi:hypothetical protein
MLPQKWSSFFSMAFIAFFIKGIGGEEFIRDRSMGIVAIGTGHFPLPHGMVR